MRIDGYHLNWLAACGVSMLIYDDDDNVDDKYICFQRKISASERAFLGFCLLVT